MAQIQQTNTWIRMKPLDDVWIRDLRFESHEKYGKKQMQKVTHTVWVSSPGAILPRSQTNARKRERWIWSNVRNVEMASAEAFTVRCHMGITTTLLRTEIFCTPLYGVVICQFTVSSSLRRSHMPIHIRFSSSRWIRSTASGVTKQRAYMDLTMAARKIVKVQILGVWSSRSPFK